MPPEPFTNLRRNEPLSAAGGYSPMDWYSMYPRMYVGDARPASAAKGKVLGDHKVAMLVQLLKAVKADRVTAELMAQFQGAARAPASPWEHIREG